MTSRSKNEDIEYGLKSEEQVLPILKKKFGSELERSKKQYSPYDYRKSGVRVELKTRNNTSHQYPTTMVGMTKVAFAKHYYGKYYFVFKFTDKTLYIRYDETKFAEYETRLGGRSDRGRIESSQYIYIPVDALKEF
jgi:hypothetical protein